MLRHPDYTRQRLQQLGDRMRGLIYPEKIAVDDLQVSPRVERISYAAARELEYAPVRLGQQFGPLWATFWFRANATAPEKWQGSRVDLLWASHSEATLWMNGRSLQGLNFEPSSWDQSVRPDAILLRDAQGGESLSFEIEMACNRVFGSTGSPFSSISPFVLDQCDIARFDQDAWDLYYDYMVLQALSQEGRKDLDQTWAGELLHELNRFANIYDPDERTTWAAGSAILQELYQRHNADSVHELSAIGHSHIDTAWLWPLGETHRKCERTFSSQTTYMEDYPEFRFSCSQAYQYQVIKDRNPDLYQRIRSAVERGQWVPVGGSWVEPDCNIPSGEALARQFLTGQRFFQQEFGITCREFWEPDVFGYNGQLPQIMRLSGITRFLTQKLSWNHFNKPVHHTFTWQGIDGSEVLAHFPPADTYNATCDISQLRDNARNYKDNDRSHHSILLFGYGDGGGGPTKRMLEIIRRAGDLQGLPLVTQHSSDEFFSLLEADCTDLPLMVGELYFEYHRGTYTTQAATKRNNRKSEFLLHDLEFLSAAASRMGRMEYPKAEIDRLWKIVCMNQFHDILPGSSIGLVYEDADRDYADVLGSGALLRQQAMDAIAPAGAGATPVNTTSFRRQEVVTGPDGALAYVDAPPYGFGSVCSAPDQVALTRQDDGRLILQNGRLKAVLSVNGTVLSLVEKSTGREALAEPANRLEIYDDHPTNFDAWDVDPFHLETRKDCAPADTCEVTLESPLRVEVSYQRSVGRGSRLTQVIRLDAGSPRLEFHCEIDWQEEHKMLKVAFPVNVRAMNATYEMQFGAVERPTHFNTPYDLARYEVPGHRWADLSEHGFGVALLSESKYGFSTFGNTMRMSLLRSPREPDPKADIGRHAFAYAVMPHPGRWEQGGVVAEGYRFNAPLLWARGSVEPQSMFSVDNPDLVLDTVKEAEGSRDMVLRLYECHGSRGVARVKCALLFSDAVYCNILEEEGEQARVDNGEILAPFGPYQIITLKLREME